MGRFILPETAFTLHKWDTNICRIYK